MKVLKFISFLIIPLLIFSCQKKKLLFDHVSYKESGITFSNKIIESQDYHYYKYIYSYNGGGLATADFNNDGLVDVLFTSNQFENKLYINKGELKFEDITYQTGFKKNNGFTSGVSVVDINNDGLLDIYISKAGKYNDERLTNELYINNGDLTFTEKAKEYGIDDSNRSTNASFFDYDKDGDLDLFVLNTPIITGRSQGIENLDSIAEDPKTIALKGHDKLYKNNNGKFTDVSKEAGIQIDKAFGLNAQISDLDNNGYLDIYVNNDFDMPDFVYLNNGDGTFTESRNKILKHMSFYSMGSDIGDIDNDGLMDIITLDMSPEDYIRSKTTMAMSSVEKFDKMVKMNYHHQYMHNMLHVNNGNGTFSDISQMAGVSNTDWSWSTLFADFDLDGFNDIYITNGIYRDVLDQDKTNEIRKVIRSKKRKPTQKDLLEYSQMFPQQKLKNYFFKNSGDRTFTNQSENWTNQNPTFSNGAAYADLDNDGDLDIIVNNINEKATVLKNNAIENNIGNYIQFKFKGSKENQFGTGVKVELFLNDNQILTRELITNRGYLSSISNKLHFGLGKTSTIPKVKIIWSDGKEQKLTNIESNQLVTINYSNASEINHKIKDNKDDLFSKQTFNYAHKDSVFNDFNRQILLPHKLSQTGPAVAVADINNDGIDDLYLGGSFGFEGQLLIGNNNGEYNNIIVNDFIEDKYHEDISATFFDSDNDGDLDLYVVSGSYEYSENHPLLNDRLYINTNGNFKKSIDLLPEINSAGSIVKASDYDNDGDIDLFIGSRVIPGLYPYSPISYLLNNEKGKFTIVTKNIAPELEKIGMVTDAVWNDIDNDNDVDLIVTGEWMGIEVFENANGKLKKSKKNSELSNQKGWWNKIVITDINNDGTKDIIAGNLGLNYKFHATKDKPFHVYTSDFDRNGAADILLAKYYKNKQVLVRGKQCTTQQIPGLEKIIPTYTDFANKDVKGVIGNNLESALHLQANEFRSGIFYQDKNGDFSFNSFENKVQQSPVNSILYNDFDGDGINDLLLAGNNYQSEIETTRADAGIGSLLKGNTKGEFTFIDNKSHGFFEDKDVRDMKIVKTNNGEIIIIANNNDKYTTYKYNTPK
ncbi:FG-GAP repeat protein [Lutibacter sp. Hel_I_33_5]|uniref:VCBS repeat-containing protein n=1 Tax=Lutibacter sp. Hel_I_33_5 TaxID=1566289 RepID=UPI0011A92215|nr:VCBS repeat-containing protein [Lutibacter sp. Hel_I_33_5]TVZ55647.1 FG-GAP repeat protein [Lutibacter sp. Hel_I_33_5]